jgi:cytochrome P450
VDQLTDDAFIIVAAASDTTGNAMTVAAYNIVSSHTIYDKLKKELGEKFPDGNAKLDFVTLEKLPYLVRCLWPGLATEDVRTDIYRPR